MWLAMQQQRAEQPKTPPQRVQPPVVLELGDGSRLVLEDASASPLVGRVEPAEGERISLDDAMRSRGQPFAGYRRLRG
jgi:hypothetical protein